MLARHLKKWTDKLGPRIQPESDCGRVTLGSEYGAHTVCPDGLSARSIVYSFGVGEDVSFDCALIERFGLEVHAFDPTERSLSWVRGQTLPAGFHMNALALGTRDGTAQFFKPKNPEHISHSVEAHDRVTEDSVEVPLRTLRTLMAERSHSTLDVLKLDIEGSEYDVLDQLRDEKIAVGQLLVEFHHQLQPIPYSRTRDCVDRLRTLGYRVFHVADNGREISLIRRDLV
jgi:FkbM family methyltransferase